MNARIGIVYFIYINPKKDWRALISGQLADVAATGILREAALYLEVSDAHVTEGLEDFLKSLPYDYAEINIHHENAFEFFGLHRLWELGRDDSHKLLIYFHTKGMSYKNKYPLAIWNRRSLRELALTYYTFKDWRRTARLFKEKPKLCKAGPFPNDTEGKSHGSFMWFNFFWVRASYVKELVEPPRRDDRFYYEAWLTMRRDGQREHCAEKCWSTYAGYARGYEEHEASAKLAYLRKIYKYTWPLSMLLRQLGLRRGF